MSDIFDYMRYDPDRGEIQLIKERGYRDRSLVGSVLGTKNGEGYLQTKFKGKIYLVHRLAWYLHYGVWPVGILDHINRDKLDNRIENLRDVTHLVNNLNKENTNGGCYFVSRINKWRSRTRNKGKEILIGHFNTKEEAQKAYEDFQNAL